MAPRLMECRLFPLRSIMSVPIARQTLERPDKPPAPMGAAGTIAAKQQSRDEYRQRSDPYNFSIGSITRKQEVVVWVFLVLSSPNGS